MSFPEKLRQQLQQRWRFSNEVHQLNGEEILAIDEAIANEYVRTISPMVIDLAGFTNSAIQHGIIHHLSKIEMLRTLLQPVITDNNGTLIKEEADNLFAYFSAPDETLKATKLIFKFLKQHNTNLEDFAQIDISVGIGYGPTLVLPNDMWGTDFNFCCKLGEDLANSNEVLLTNHARSRITSDQYQFEEKAFVIGGMPMRAYRLIY